VAQLLSPGVSASCEGMKEERRRRKRRKRKKKKKE